MNTRAQLDAELDHLAAMLAPWLEHSRHHAQFWPQFNALARTILAAADSGDRAHVLQRLDAMLMRNRVSRRSRQLFAFDAECNAALGPDADSDMHAR